LQPVFHIYNLYYLFYEGVILSELPPKNKYYNPLFKTDHVNITPEFIDFITANFLNTKSIKYEPTKTDIESYYKNSKDSLLTSYYYNNTLIGCITGRQLTIKLKLQKFDCYYIDLLCVDKLHRNKNIAPMLIQTHEYNQRKQTNISVSLFKREGKLNLIVPLVIYNTYGFNTYNWKPTININIIKINKDTLKLVYDIISTYKIKCLIIPKYHVLLDLINNNVIDIYIINNNNIINAIYFFKNPATKYYNKKTIESIGSFNINLTNDIFIEGFINIINKIDHNFVWIENLVDNNIFISSCLKNYSLSTICPMAYYFYNYATLPIDEREIFIIS